jgi:hypothetical protein
MLRGSAVYRVVWLPGSDRLRGYCWCGAPHEAEDPVELWEWLLDHPGTHGDGPAEGRTPDPAPSADRPLAGTRA